MPIQSKSRSELLTQLFRQLMSWNGTSVNANEIIAQNQPLLAELKEIDASLSQQGKGEYTEMEKNHVASIVKAQQNLLDVVKQDRAEILEKMKQVNQKNKIVDNYYSSFQQSVFVDKGM